MQGHREQGPTHRRLHAVVSVGGSHIQRSDQDSPLVGIPGGGDPVALQQISGQRPGAAFAVDRDVQRFAAGFDRGLALEDEAVSAGAVRLACAASHQLPDSLPQLLTTIERAVLLQLQQIPALTRAAPHHRPVVVVHHAAIFVGGGFRMGHHPLDRDVFGAPAPARGDRSGFRAEAVELRRSGRQRPGVGLAAHAGAGEGHGIAVARPGVGRQIHAGGMQPVHPAVAADDHVIVAGPDPVVAGGGPVQVDRGGHEPRQASGCSLQR